MEPPLTTDEEFEVEFQRRLEKYQQTIQERFSSESLAWLALVPAWTEPLAAACEFPTSNLGLDEFLIQTQTAGLCERSVSMSLDGTTTKIFWMPNAVQNTQIRELKRQPGATYLLGRAVEIGKRLSKQTNTESPSVLKRWSDLACTLETGLDQASLSLQNTVERLVREGKTGEALAWIDSASSLAHALGGDLEMAVGLASRKVELAYRQAQDARLLESYVQIDDQDQAFKDLLVSGPSTPWGLHYVGMGGVGKTMLMRYITNHFQDEVLTARVDFDYLGAEYPSLKPGELLLHFGEDLHLYSETLQQESAFIRLKQLVQAFHQRLLSERPPHPLAPLADDQFKQILELFAEILNALPRRPVLILDTCEELTKLQPYNDQLPSLEATFTILEDLHQLVPEMRVIFAGRRLLALAGVDWQAGATGASYLPHTKTYLRIHEIRGFTRGQALSYLLEKKQLKLSTDMVNAVLEKSQETGTAVDIIQQRPPQQEMSRYNPFDLSLYANWLREDRDLTAAEILSGETDPYIELRIIQRLHQQPDVQALLPAAALLGRFTQEMVEKVTALSSSNLQEAFRKLRGQEWIDHKIDPDLNIPYLQIDPNLYPRFKKYFQNAQSYALESISLRLASRLEELIFERHLEAINADLVGPALELLPASRAAGLWEHLERRLVREGRWEWAEGILRRLLAEGNALGSLEHPVRAHAFATMIAARMHNSPGYDPSPDWDHVLLTLNSHPDETIRSWLARRALAGSLETVVGLGRIPEEKQLLEFAGNIKIISVPSSPDFGSRDQFLAEQLYASFATTLEALLDVSELGNLWENAFSAADIDRFAAVARESVSPNLACHLQMLAARTLIFHQKRHGAANRFTRAEKLAMDSPVDPEQAWLDWIAPASPVDRVRLEILHWLSLNELTEELIPARSSSLSKVLLLWQSEAEKHLPLVDAERLLSRILRVRMAENLNNISTQELDRQQSIDPYDPNRRPVALVHRRTAPLFVSRAHAWASLGQASKAVNSLEEFANLAERTNKKDVETPISAGVAILQIVRQARMLDTAYNLMERLCGNENPWEAEASWAAAALAARADVIEPSQPGKNASKSFIFAWWSCQSLPNRSTVKKAISYLLQSHFPIHTIRAAKTMEELHEALIYQEAMQVSSRFSVKGLPSRLKPYRADPMALQQLLETKTGWTEEAIRLLLRLSAMMSKAAYHEDLELLLERLSQLVGRSKKATALSEIWSQSIGRRRLAELSMEEGELLALRLPQYAYPLLVFAEKQFSQVDDHLGGFRAIICAALSVAMDARVSMTDSAEKSRQNTNRKTIEKRVRDLLLIAKEHYRMLRTSRSLKVLPEWKEMESQATKIEAVNLRGLSSGLLGGWLLRLIACFAWLNMLSSPKQATGIRQAFENTFGGELPNELDLWSIQPVTQKASETSGEPELQEIKLASGEKINVTSGGTVVAGNLTNTGAVIFSLEPRLRDWITILGGLVIVLGAVVVGYFLFSQAISYILSQSIGLFGPPLTISTPMQIFLYVLLLSILALWGSIRNWLRSILAAQTRLELLISQLGETTVRKARRSRSGEVMMRLVESHSLLYRIWYRQKTPSRELKEFSFKAPNLSAYQHQYDTIPKDIATSLDVLKGELGSKSIRVPLQVDSLLDGIPWEALLSFSLPQKDRPKVDTQFQFWRARHGSSDPRRLQKQWQSRRIAYRGSDRWLLEVEDGWRPLGSKLVPITRSYELKQLEDQLVLHLLGTAAETSLGLVLEIGSFGRSGRLEVAQKPLVKASKEYFQERIPEPVVPDTVAVSSASLIIVQGEPAELGLRTESEREQMMLLRSFASQLVTAGARAVLTIPPLPSGLVSSVLRALASELIGSSPPRLGRLLEATAQVRTLIADWKPAFPIEVKQSRIPKLSEREQEINQLELAWEVTLFYSDPEFNSK